MSTITNINPVSVGLGGLGGALSGQQGQSNSSAFGMSRGEESSWGNSVNDSWGNQYSDAFGSASGNSYGYGMGENWSEGSSWGNGENSAWNSVYGSAASARDIERAAEANAQQEYFARLQMAYNAEEAKKARDYETMMSNTAYQRAIADLKKAGLNPILAAGNMGASTPTGAMASTGMASSAKAQTFADQEGGSYGYSKSGSSNKSYGYNKSENRSSYSARNESHSRGSSGSHGESASGSQGKSGSFNTSRSHSENTNNLAKMLKGIGDLFSGLSSAQKTYPGDNKGTGKSAYDGYDMPTVSN